MAGRFYILLNLISKSYRVIRYLFEIKFGYYWVCFEHFLVVNDSAEKELIDFEKFDNSSYTLEMVMIHAELSFLCNVCY